MVTGLAWNDTAGWYVGDLMVVIEQTELSKYKSSEVVMYKKDIGLQCATLHGREDETRFAEGDCRSAGLLASLGRYSARSN
jgi:hypothetical protein